MGLDMFLYARRYIAGDGWANNSYWGGPHMFDKVITAVDGKDLVHYEPGGMAVEVSIQVMYWRKANAIHGWFVRNVQDGVDDCGIYDVSRESLADLADLCDDVISGKNTSALEPVSGFFFGSTERDEGYLHDLKYTRDRIRKLLEATELRDHWYFRYSSSW